MKYHTFLLRFWLLFLTETFVAHDVIEDRRNDDNLSIKVCFAASGYDKRHSFGDCLNKTCFSIPLACFGVQKVTVLP